MREKKDQITHPDKVLFPRSKITKKDLADYYKYISKKMIPYIKDRPISLMRYPNGINKIGFFQKNIETFPKWITRIRVKKEDKSTIEMVLCNTSSVILYLANLGCISLHMWLSKKDKPLYPDRIIFDLDPPGGRFSLAVKTALLMKEIIEKELKLTPFVMTTGSRGLHVIIPIKREKNFDEVRDFAKKLARYVVSKNLKQLTIEQRKNKRRGRLYVDYMRNAYAQTAIVPYSLRAIEKAPIATPLAWHELKKTGLSSQTFNMSNIKTRLKKKNPWNGMDRKAKSIIIAVKRLEKLNGKD